MGWISQLQKELIKLRYRLSQLPIDEQIEIIYSICVDHLNEADDYEVYSRVFDLLVDIQSDDLQLFVKRCIEHTSPDIQEIVEDWNN